MLGRWANGTNESSTKRLMFQVLFFFPGATVLLWTLLHKVAHFKGLCLLLLTNFPEAMFIQGATSIPDSRVGFEINVLIRSISNVRLNLHI